MWNTNDDRYSDFGHFLKMLTRPCIETFPHFLILPTLKMWKRLYIETYPHFLILSIF